MNRRRIAVVTAVATAAALLPAAGSVAVAADSGSKILLRGSGAIIGGSDGGHLRRLGDAPDATAVTLSLAAPLPDQSQVQALVDAGTVLTPAEYTKRFGASQSSVDRISKWAKQQGFTVTYVSRDSGQVFVKGTVGKVNRSMHLRMQRARLGTVTGLAPNADPTVSRSSGITAVGGLSTLGRKQPLSVKSPQRVSLARKAAPNANGATDGSTDCSTYWGEHLYPKVKKYSVMSNGMCGYIPQELQGMYGAGSVAAQQPTLGLLLWGNDSNVLARTNEYMKEVGFPPLNAANYKVFLSGKTPPADCPDDGAEQTLDVQSTHAIAPSATIHYYDAGTCYDTGLTATLQKMVTAHQVSTISMSFGASSDAGMTAADKALWDRPLLQAAATGITTFAASGDSGNNSTVPENKGAKGVGYPASSSYTTAVGGTSVGLSQTGTQAVAAGWERRVFYQPNTNADTFTELTFNPKYLPIYGAGGGQSAVSTQPSWQKGKVGAYTRRAVPDVAALADPTTPYIVRMTDPDTGQGVYYAFGGTSLASPIVAALSGLAKRKNGVAIGLGAPYFYKLAGTSAIKDINYAGRAGLFFPGQVAGTGTVVGLDAEPEDLVTTAGWDNVTGVGSPNGISFINAFK